MAVDPEAAKALNFAPLTFHVERGQLRFFAKAIGEMDPVYCDVAAATDAGHPDLPVPPTFFFSMELQATDGSHYIDRLGVDMRRVLHGEQSFAYYEMVHAGETVTLRPRITDVYSKKGGALDFVVKQTEIKRNDQLVAEATNVIVVRNPEGAQ